MEFLAQLEILFKAWIAKAVPILEADGELLVAAFRTVWAAAAPAEMAALASLVQEAVGDVLDGDYADLETAVLNKAATQGLTFVADLGSAELAALIAIFKAAPAAA